MLPVYPFLTDVVKYDRMQSYSAECREAVRGGFRAIRAPTGCRCAFREGVMTRVVGERRIAMGALERLPGWARRLDEMSGHFSEAGLGGLLDYHEATNTLGELLAQGIVTREELRAWFTEQVGKHEPESSAGAGSVAAALLADPRAFWEQVWEAILGKQVNVPPVPRLKAKTKKATEEYLLMLLFLPAITEADYPAEFVKPAWSKHLTVSSIQRRPLPGRWVIVETIRKPNWNDPQGYGDGNDPLTKALGLAKRFAISWNTLHETHFPATAKLLGLSKKAVRLTTTEEWNLIGNLFLWLNRHRNMTLPDLGSTNSWEWCENAYDDDARLVVGSREGGGLADVLYDWHGSARCGIGFRVLAVP